MSLVRPRLLPAILLLLSATVASAADPCTAPMRAPFAKHSLVPRAAFAKRAKVACAIRAIGAGAAPVQWTQLRLYLHANGQAPLLLPQSGANFTASLNSQNLGAISATYTNAGTTALSNVRLVAFADLDIERNNNGFSNEFGNFVSLATPPGAPAGAIAATSWEIDEPGFLFGDILTNTMNAALDNFNAVPNSTPDDVSLALQFPVGALAPGQLFNAQLRLDTTNIGGLRQTDPDSSITIFFNGFVAKSSAPPPAPPPPPTPEIPSPSSLPLLLLGLGLTFACRRQLFGKTK
jgi:hypothetical protein